MHGLGVAPADGVLYVAAHGGSSDSWTETWSWWRTDPRTPWASPSLDRATSRPAVTPPPPNWTDRTISALIESRDAAGTWTERSLSGTAGFHSLAPSPGGLYAYDSVSATVMRTTDHNLDRGDAWGGPRASPPTPATPTRC